MNRIHGRLLLVVVIALAFPTPARAVNWLMLQGTEPDKAPAFRLFGHAAIDYQYTDDSRLAVGPWSGQKAAFNQIGPRLESASQLTLRRVRIGARGVTPDPRFNYLVSAVAGDNDATRIDTADRVRFVDASLTMNVIPHARLRLGMFKYPGAEEGLQFNAPGNYINLSNVGNQVLQERFYDNDGGNPYHANIPGAGSTFRDIGLMLFDSLRSGPWQHSYAAMIGNGRGISTGGGSPGEDLYLYWSSEYVLGGKGMQQEGLKLFAWLQDGERTIKAGPAQVEQDFDRCRYGAGTTFRRGDYRVTAEVIKADGMIFNSMDLGGVPGAVGSNGFISSYNVLPNEEAFGWYVDLGYQLRPGWWLDLRYDRLDRGTEISANERRFTTLTLGSHYFITPALRLMVNYEIRDNTAPNLSDNAPANIVLDTYDNRLSLQVFWMF
ncbi:MAG: porin [Thermodesulfobacteriota bacterium]